MYEKKKSEKKEKSNKKMQRKNVYMYITFKWDSIFIKVSQKLLHEHHMGWWGFPNIEK